MKRGGCSFAVGTQPQSFSAPPPPRASPLDLHRLLLGAQSFQTEGNMEAADCS